MTAEGAPVVTYDTRWGKGWVVFDPDGPLELGLPGTRLPGRSRPSEASREVADLVARLQAYWRGGDLPAPTPRMVDIAGRTPHLRAIYEVVSRIPAGRTATYAEVAARVGNSNAARSVGAAMARNPFAPVIPCHRVVGTDGSLRGYGGGLVMKRAMLEMEGAL